MTDHSHHKQDMTHRVEGINKFLVFSTEKCYFFHALYYTSARAVLPDNDDSTVLTDIYGRKR
ncbi:hypothetical protein CEE37_13725 [candidate division LCP-89 bacterium B3_LCP]|uniref:Uncharacterized protein n=1 Tax=candidate division LCP-89 bacterium B3_LCP TaxID=2012998 RepID=A0A532URL1_UNCL8|nr:MAG: hypothetical protein CEE37_13725 [candidate division LCP-89 bacterium B3_LCP]